MPDFTDVAIAQQDFDDIEPKPNLRILQKAQVIECRLGEKSFLIVINGRSWACPILRRASLNLDEDETVAIAENEVYLAPRRPVILDEKLEANFSEVSFSSFFTENAMTQMQGQRRPPGPRCNAPKKKHITPGKDWGWKPEKPVAEADRISRVQAGDMERSCGDG